MDNLHFLGEKISERKYEIAKMVHAHRMTDLKEVKDINLPDEEIIELRAYQGMEKVLAKRFMLYIEKPSTLKIEG